MHKLDVFQTKCLRRICNISWLERYQIRVCTGNTDEMVLRMLQDHIPRVALRWTHIGKRSKGRPKTTWRRSIIAGLYNMLKTVKGGQMELWLSVPPGNEEDK